MRVFIILCWLAVFTSCEKEASSILNCDPIISRCDTALNFLPVTDTCFDIPPSPPFGYVNTAPTFNYGFPIFSPFDSEQFFYGEGDRTDTNHPVSFHWKINIGTGEKETSLSPSNFPHILEAPPSWSNKDWFVFNTTGNDVWIVKSNGDSLQQITSASSYK